LLLEKNLYLLDLQTYIKYFHGITILLIFTILVLTSNDWSVKKLKSSWKKIHNLTYLLMFLLIWHILASMAKHWSHVTPFGVSTTLIISILFIRRKWIEQIASKRKQKIIS
jgi:methionine sulfoxide reductase heme-binding subunit